MKNLKKVVTKSAKTFEDLFNISKKIDVDDLIEHLIRESETLHVIPDESSQSYRMIDRIIIGFEDRISILVSEILEDHRIMINSLYPEEIKLFGLYVLFIKDKVVEEVRTELFYLVKLIETQKNRKHFKGNLLEFSIGDGVALNQTNLKILVRRTKIITGLLFSILKSNNSKWLEQYFKVYRELNTYKNFFPYNYSQDTSEYYIAEVLLYISNVKATKKKPSFNSFSTKMKIPRSTLIERLKKLGVYDQIISILKVDGKLTVER